MTAACASSSILWPTIYHASIRPFWPRRRDPASPQREWFFFREYPETYEAFYDVPDQPIVNTDHPAAREYLIGAAQHWLELGCDGFRLDHAHGATHAFWSAFRAGTRAARADAAIFGEITDTPALMRSYAGRMDGVLDFPLLDLLRGFFAFQSIGVSQFDRALRQHFGYFGAELVLPSFLDNHDMNRFLWLVGGDTRRLKLAALCQFTLPQPPIVYYGTEVGLSQRQAVGRLEEARLPMLWDEAQDQDLLDFYRRLIALRRQTRAAWSLPRATLLVDDERGLYAVRCGAYTVALNNRDREAVIDCGATELILGTDAHAALGRRPAPPAPVCGCRAAARIKPESPCRPAAGRCAPSRGRRADASRPRCDLPADCAAPHRSSRSCTESSTSNRRGVSTHPPSPRRHGPRRHSC